MYLDILFDHLPASQYVLIRDVLVSWFSRCILGTPCVELSAQRPAILMLFVLFLGIDRKMSV
jgi:hypothetical protein